MPGWAKRYVDITEESALKTKLQVAASLDAEDGFTTLMKVGDHYMTADEPLEVGGNDFGPSPYEPGIGRLIGLYGNDHSNVCQEKRLVSLKMWKCTLRMASHI